MYTEAIDNAEFENPSKAIDAAISRSCRFDCVVPVQNVNAAFRAELERRCDGSVPECGDYWGDDDGSEWRIYIEEDDAQ